MLRVHFLCMPAYASAQRAHRIRNFYSEHAPLHCVRAQRADTARENGCVRNANVMDGGLVISTCPHQPSSLATRLRSGARRVQVQSRRNRNRQGSNHLRHVR